MKSPRSRPIFEERTLSNPDIPKLIEIANIIKKSYTISSLTIRCKKYGDDEVDILIDLVCKSPALQSIHIRKGRCDVSSKKAAELLEACKENPNFLQLDNFPFASEFNQARKGLFANLSDIPNFLLAIKGDAFNLTELSLPLTHDLVKLEQMSHGIVFNRYLKTVLWQHPQHCERVKEFLLTKEFLMPRYFLALNGIAKPTTTLNPPINDIEVREIEDAPSPSELPVFMELLPAEAWFRIAHFADYNYSPEALEG
jgi:hypothetical protein